MSYEYRTYDDDNGDPVVVLVASGTHDVSRVVQALTHGNCEQMSIGMIDHDDVNYEEGPPT